MAAVLAAAATAADIIGRLGQASVADPGSNRLRQQEDGLAAYLTVQVLHDPLKDLYRSPHALSRALTLTENYF